MIDYKKKVKSLIRKYKTRDPYTIAKELGIIVKLVELSPYSPKGIFKKVLRRKFIIINITRVTDEFDFRAVMAHELGHAIRHCSDSTFFLHDHTLYRRGKFEIEANEFAAELLIDETKIEKLYLENFSAEQLACAYEVSAELIKYKFTCK
ncbi:ImmA/IrrE family metallo-endopeptidase [Clostridium butyricum]|uniref:ImmA/IrrE family metallo-endopeptidase n=1 Tax=Clostridium butyricum TaxID=1492 RepID=UPI0005C14500|nr:ImmA/IrrE family metallo-endopeptidase [Clostridium butyricum]ALS17786.1 hypothetical protein ATD26_13150 [Clostridium butyricum]KIU08857.1 putative immunity region protein 2 [Clostridium butyricum]MBA8965126.1 Zn-dependent peptidase ImmA (M78 family) [Clostridium butyricum]MBA8965187.1 Zn-dependent peptidase ImmA (M78 family) [Clostridium butyricum]MBA8970256.1 Zn-dependent peptidase ImmA (M78 family) [Clostridium butyricum]